MKSTFDQIKDAEKAAQEKLEKTRMEADKIIKTAQETGEEMLSDIPVMIAEDIKRMVQDADRTIKGYHETMKNHLKKDIVALEKLSDKKIATARAFIHEAIQQFAKKN